MDEQVRAQIETKVKSNKVVLFMKGSRSFPQCGFSATVVSILNQLVPKYETVNVLTDPAIRDGVKEYAQWPTIPQLFVDGEFVGGCDIVKSMHASGELAKLLGVTPAAPKGPTLIITPAAQKAIKDVSGPGAEVLRIDVDARFTHDLYFGDKAGDDVVVTVDGLAVHLSPESAARLDGTKIDFLSTSDGGGFKIDNPNEPPRVKALSPRALKAMLDAKEPLELFDVRTPEERATAAINPSRLLDQAGQDHIFGLDKNTTLVFHCHHGSRSQRAAEHFLGLGYKNVYNLDGGIDAWSETVDATVPRY